MLIEASIQDLVASTNTIDTDARQHVANQVQFTNGFQAVPAGKDIIFQGTTSTGHNPKFRISGMQKDEGPQAIQVMSPSGPLKILPLSKQAQTLVTCDCEDFVFRFATTDQARGVLFGKITRPYIPKTDRATQNLGKVGVCKHLIKFVDLLSAQGVLK
jgi:hypothetical protein